MSAADFHPSGIEKPSQSLAPLGPYRSPVGLLVMLAVAVAAAFWPSGHGAVAETARSDQVILFLNRDFSGPTKTWSLKPGQPFLAVPFTGDDFRPAGASIKLGADVGVLLFEHPFFSTVDETCDYRLGDATDSGLWWRSDKAMFVPGPREEGPVEGNLRAQAVASLILYRRALGPPPGALLLERRRYVNWDCDAPTKARGYRRIFVPVAAAHHQGCFNLDVALSYGSSGTVALDFSAASELLLLAPRDLAADYAEIDHRFTASLHGDRDCAGAAVDFFQSESGERRFDLKPFGLDRKARSVMLRYDGGPYDALLAAGPEPEASDAGAVETPPEGDPAEPAQDTRADAAKEPRDEATGQAAAEISEEDHAEISQAAPAVEARPEPIAEPDTGAPTGSTAEPAARSEQSEALETAESLDAESEALPEAKSDSALGAAVEATESGIADTPEPASTSDLAPAGETMTETQAAGGQAPEAQAPAAEATAAQVPAAQVPDGEARDAAAPEAAGADTEVTGENEPEAGPPLAQIAQSDVAQSDVAQSDVAQPDVAQPDVAQSDVAQSETTQRETPQSDTSDFLVLPEAEEEAVAVGQSFELPLLQGYRLNFCLYRQDEGCGQEAATKWCEARGFGGGAASFEIDENIGSLFPTLALGDLQLCANFVCDGFKEITCLP